MYFNVYKSSAGSGKTFTLVKEYVQLVLANPKKFRHILAVTFTNKAANEMKQRILLSLKEIAHPEKNPDAASVKIMLPEISKQSGLPVETLSQNAQSVITSVLHNYSEFAVSTIDSFMHRVIRSFAFDLHIPFDFEVELEEKELLQKMVDILISRAGTEEKLTRFLVEFTRSKAENEKDWKIERDLFQIAEILLKEDSTRYLDQLKKLTLDDFTKVIAYLQNKVYSFENRLIKTASEILDLIRSNGISTSDFYGGRSGIAKYFEYLSEGNFEKVQPNQTVYKTIEEDKWSSGKVSADTQIKIAQLKPFIIQAFDEIQNFLNKNFQSYILYSDILKNIYPLAIINEIEKILDEYKSENNILLISEFNKRIAEIVIKEPIPFIYERIGEKYQHFLIDEFQDTSILQWRNLLPLIDNALSVNHFTMVVGDGKQAIYRWRSGEVEQFASLPKVYHRDNDPLIIEREQALVRNYNQNVLKRNFRSRKEIVNFNNKFFTQTKQYIDDSLRSIYDDILQDPGTKKEGGYIQLDFFNKKENDISFGEFNHIRILEFIRDAITRGYQKKDIAVLCRNNRNASAIARMLLENGIQVISSESLLIANSEKVKVVIAMIKILLNNDDLISKTEVIHWLSQIKKAPEFHTSLKMAGIFTPGEENNNAHRKDFFLFIADLGFHIETQKLLSLPVYELCEEIIRQFEMSRQADAYLQYLLDAVLEFSKSAANGIHDLIDWWEEAKDKLSIIVPEGVDAVNIMTIHKAKGLEFPVVIYPFADGWVKKTKENLWVDLNQTEIPDLPVALISTTQKMEESIFSEEIRREAGKSFLDLVNLLYVVMTRPTDELFIITQHPPARSGSTPSIPVLYSQFLKSEGQWNDAQNTFTYGTKTEVKSIGRASNNQYSLDSWISQSWQNRIRVSFQAPMHWNVEEMDRKMKWGTLMHSILSEVKTPENIDEVIARFRSSGKITMDESNKLKVEINEFLSDSQIKKYFQPNKKVKTEPEIILPDGSIYRPDRIIFDEEKATVIDFKTGSHNPSHEKQVKQYMEILRQMSFKTEGVLLYIYAKEKVKYIS